MKISALALIVATMSLTVGCSDENNSQRTATSSAPAAASAPAASASASAPAAALTKIALSSDLPASLKTLPSEAGGRCAVDIVNKLLNGNKDIALKRNDGLTMYGWALNIKAGSVPKDVVLNLVNGTDNYYALLNRRGGRDDLAKAFKIPAFSNAGFGGLIDIATLPAGKYDINIIQKTDTNNLVCATNLKLNLAD